MKKKLLGVLILCFMLLPWPLAAEPGGVWDQAGLFSQEELQALNARIAELEAEHDQALGILTIADAEGKTTKLYAEDFYVDNNLGFGAHYDGALLLIDMDNREVWITTSGISVRYLSDERIETVLDEVYADLSEENFSAAGEAFLRLSASYLGAGISEGQYNYDSATGETSYYRVPPIAAILLGGLLLSAVISLIFYFRIKGQYAFKPRDSYYPYKEKSQLSLLRNRDIFLHKDLSRVPIPKAPPPSSGGGGGGSGGGGARSTVSTHSSGRSFGGGGRKF